MRPERILDQERVFDAGKYIYTRTDRRGVILSANRYFVQLCGYDVDKMLGAPHKIVRHPDVPRGVFYLLWQTLQDGKPFSAFVKNLAADGSYYWTCAIVAPIDEGYLSVSAKPQGECFDHARALYAGLLADEAAGASPAESAALLRARLEDSSHGSLDNFMATALADIAAEKGAPNCPVNRLRQLRAEMLRLDTTQRDLLATLKKLYLIPTNMRILASRLEPSGGPVSAISDSYKRAASELMGRLHQRMGDVTARPSGTAAHGADTGVAMVNRALFFEAAAAILGNAAQQFAAEETLPGVDSAAERASLSHSLQLFRNEAVACSGKMTGTVIRVGKEAEHIKRLMSGLDQIRILGEVESGRLRNSDGGLAAIMTQLTTFHGLIHARLSAMTNAANRMRAGAE